MEQSPSAPPPFICVNDRFLLQYAILNDSMSYSGKSLVSVGRKEVGWVPCLAICQDKDSPSVTLYFCDSDWNLIAVVGCGTVERGKNITERMYPGVLALWIEAHFTDEDANRYFDELFSDIRCSFCQKTPGEALTATFTSDGENRICADCARLAGKEDS
jgi:hypothetical protein